MLITLLLVDRGVLSQPLLYLSLYLKQHRDEYFDHLQAIRMEGEWEEWILFFLEAVARTSERAVQLAHDLLALFQADKARVEALGTRSVAAVKIYEQLKRVPYLSAGEASQLAGVSFPTAANGLLALEKLDIVDELTKKERGKLYRYTSYLKLLNEGTELS